MRIFLFAALGLLLLASACNKPKEQRTTSGFRYIIYEDKDGNTPEPGDIVFFHATVRKNGSDSVYYDTRTSGEDTPSLQIPTEEIPGQPASPVVDLIRLLSVGDSARVIYELDTLPQKPMGFEDAKELYYDIVVLEIKKTSDLKAEEDRVATLVNEFAKTVSEGKQPEGMKSTTSGLQYVILKQGDGASADPGKDVKVHYYGALPDGTLFDTSLSRGTPLPFQLGDPGLIPGWTEGVDLLNQGGSAILYIPSELGYGEAGAPPVIPGNSKLVFYIEVVSVQ